MLVVAGRVALVDSVVEVRRWGVTWVKVVVVVDVDVVVVVVVNVDVVVVIVVDVPKVVFNIVVLVV